MRYTELDEIHPGDSTTRQTGLDNCLAEAARALAVADLGAVEQALAEALRWNPASTRVWHARAEACQLCGDSAGQREALAIAVELSVDREDVTAWLAELTEMTGDEHHRCNVCRQVAILGGAQYQTSKGERMCPRCHATFRQDKAGGSGRLYSAAILLMVVLAPAALLLGAGTTVGLAMNYLLFLLFIPALIAFHELSHALACLAVGGRLMRAQLGVGPRLANTKWRGVDFVLRKYPIAGAAYIGFVQPRLIRLRKFVAVAAGPLFHLVLVLALMPIADWGEVTGRVDWLASLFWANVLLFVTSSIPLKMVNSVLGAPTDGFHLLQILQGKMSALEIRASYFATAMVMAIQDRDYEQAASVAEEGLAVFPDSPILLANQAIVYGEMERYTEASALLKASHVRQLELAEDPAFSHLPDGYQLSLVISSNGIEYYAAVRCLINGEARPSLAAARENQRLMPWSAAVTGTLGAVLVALGRPSIGLMYLEHTLSHGPDQAQGLSAEDLAWSALALQRTGRHKRARLRLDQARARDCKPRLLRVIAAEVESHATATDSLAQPPLPR